MRFPWPGGQRSLRLPAYPKTTAPALRSESGGVGPGPRRVHDLCAVHLVLSWDTSAKRQFFVFEPEAVTDDVEHILRRYFLDRRLAEIKVLSKPTRLEQQRIILKLFDYRLCDAAAKTDLNRSATCGDAVDAADFHSARGLAVPCSSVCRSSCYSTCRAWSASCLRRTAAHHPLSTSADTGS